MITVIMYICNEEREISSDLKEIFLFSVYTFIVFQISYSEHVFHYWYKFKTPKNEVGTKCFKSC